MRKFQNILIGFILGTLLLVKGHAQLSQPGYVPGGNSFGVNSTIGLNDAFSLGIKTNNVTALTVDSTQFIDSATQPRMLAYNNTTQSINSGAVAVLTFNSEDYDVGGMHSTSSNTGRATIPTGGDGLYLIIGHARIDPMGAGTQSGLLLLKNGATTLKVFITGPFAAASDREITDLQVLAAGDFIELQGYQDSGGAINFGSATRANACSLILVKLW